MATAQFTFSPATVAQQIEKVGVDVRPIIEIRMEQVRMYDWYRSIAEKYPDVFDTLQVSPNQFEIKKRFVVPGKGEAELATLAVTNRGFGTNIPRRLAVLDAELDLPDTNKMDERIVDIIKMFLAKWPTRRVLRVGKVQEYIFDCGDMDVVEFLTKKFTRLSGISELFLRFNQKEQNYNRVFQIDPIPKARRSADGHTEKAGFGIRVSVDFNNADMEELSIERIWGVLREANEFHAIEAFDLLNTLGAGS